MGPQFWFACWVSLQALGCSTKKPEETTYFDRTISPILQDSCVSTNTGANCHVTQERGNAIGNLSLANFEDLSKRHDLLVNYGPYGLPNMLLKNVAPYDILYTPYDGASFNVRTDIRHSGGQTLGITSSGFHTLKAWIAGGATKNNANTPPVPASKDDCSEVVPDDPAFMADTDPTTADFVEFKTRVHPILGDSCAAGNCHGSPANSLRLVCATGAKSVSNDVLARWNYFAATQYIATTAQNLGASEVLRRPLDPAGGGVYHEGGAVFANQSDAGYVTLRDWVTHHGPNRAPP